MANDFRLWVVCPVCDGTAVALLNRELHDGEDVQPCQMCELDEGNPIGPADFDGLRHIYYGRIEKIDD